MSTVLHDRGGGIISGVFISLVLPDTWPSDPVTAVAPVSCVTLSVGVAGILHSTIEIEIVKNNDLISLLSKQCLPSFLASLYLHLSGSHLHHLPHSAPAVLQAQFLEQLPLYPHRVAI